MPTYLIIFCFFGSFLAFWIAEKCIRFKPKNDFFEVLEIFIFFLAFVFTFIGVGFIIITFTGIVVNVAGIIN